MDVKEDKSNDIITTTIIDDNNSNNTNNNNIESMPTATSATSANSNKNQEEEEQQQNSDDKVEEKSEEEETTTKSNNNNNNNNNRNLLNQYKSLISSICDSNLKSVKELLRLEPRLVELRDIYGNTPMHVALQQQQEQQQLRMMMMNEDLDDDDDEDDSDDGNAAAAVVDGREQIMKSRASKGNDDDADHHHDGNGNNNDEEEKCSANNNDRDDEVQLFSILEHIIVEYSYVLSKADGLNRTPLHVAISSHTPNLYLIELLIQHSPPQVMSFGDDTGSTPLHLAGGFRDCVGNANNNDENNIEETMIPTSIIFKILDKNAKYTSKAIHMIDDNGRTILHEACRPSSSSSSNSSNNNHIIDQNGENHNNNQNDEYVDFLQRLLIEWPTSAVVLDEYGKLPYDDVLRSSSSNIYQETTTTTTTTTTLQYVENATKDVICAIIEALYSTTYNNDGYLHAFLDSIIIHIESTLALSVISHQNILKLRESSNSNISLLLQTKFRPYMSDVLMKRLIDQPDLQIIFKLKEDDIVDTGDTNNDDEINGTNSDDDDDVDSEDGDDDEEENNGDDREDGSRQQQQQKSMMMNQMRNLIHDLYRMNNSGRYDYPDDPGNKAKGVIVLSSVSNSCNGLYWHLRENPTLMA